jgi:hypothetical protein
MSEVGAYALSQRERFAARFRRNRCPPRPFCSPRLCRDQVRAVYYLKRFEGRPMTKLVQEAVDLYLAPDGGVDALIARGITEFGDRGEEPPRRRGDR